MRGVLVIALTALLLGGCSHMVLRADDSKAERSQKIWSRVGIGIVTLGISEAFFGPAQVKQ